MTIYHSKHEITQTKRVFKAWCTCHVKSFITKKNDEIINSIIVVQQMCNPIRLQFSLLHSIMIQIIRIILSSRWGFVLKTKEFAQWAFNHWSITKIIIKITGGTPLSYPSMDPRILGKDNNNNNRGYPLPYPSMDPPYWER